MSAYILESIRLYIVDQLCRGQFESMDPKLKVLLELILHSILKSGGKEYIDPIFNLQMFENGLCSIQYAPLLDQLV